MPRIEAQQACGRVVPGHAGTIELSAVPPFVVSEVVLEAVQHAGGWMSSMPQLLWRNRCASAVGSNP